MWRKCPRLFNAISSKQSFSTKTGLTVKKINEINSHREKIDRIHAAIDQSYYALAILISQQLPKNEMSIQTKHQLVRGLAQFNPRLMPVNLMALHRLNKDHGLELESVDKALILKSLISYQDQNLFIMGLNLLSEISGGPIPASAIMDAVKFATQSNHITVCVKLWEYVEEHYSLTLARNTSLVTDLMRVFAQSEKNKHLAAKIARACLINTSNPSIALSIAKVGYMLKDRDLVKALLASTQFNLSREMKGAIVQLDAALGAYTPPEFPLTPQEFSGVVKAIARDDLSRAEDMVSDQISSDLEGRDVISDNESEILSNISLCNQYIEEHLSLKFQEVMAILVRLKAPSGILLNLRLKWELLYGSFSHAKRHYQNRNNTSLKQRVIALNTLKSLATSESERQWIANERQRLKLIKVKT